MRLRILICSIAALGLFATAACSDDDLTDAIEDSLDGEAAALAEADLPNCSRVINCCANLKGRDFTPDEINTECDETFKPSANSIITNYQDARDAIDADSTVNAEGKSTLKDTLKSNTQERIEPACRCFLEETVGQAGNFALPADCEAVPDENTIMCSEAEATLLDAVDNPPGSE